MEYIKTQCAMNVYNFVAVADPTTSTPKRPCLDQSSIDIVESSAASDNSEVVKTPTPGNLGTPVRWKKLGKTCLKFEYLIL